MGEKTRLGIISDLKVCKKVFDELNIKWALQGGGALGYGRYKDIMEWDTDIDLGIFVELDAKKRAALFDSLRKNGYKIADRGKDFILGKRTVTINIWFFHKNGNFYEAYPRTTPGYKFIEKALWYDEPQIVDFLGDKYPLPNHIDNFLEDHYGLDWKTNIIKSHKEYFKEKRGIRNNIPNWYSNRRRKSDGQLWWPAILKIEENIEDLLP